MSVTHHPTLCFSDGFLTFTAANGVFTTLDIENFLNFDDIIRSPHLHGSCPLGYNLWFNLHTLSFSSSKQSSDFRFTPNTWKTYLKRGHARALTCIKHWQNESDKYDACYEACPRDKPRSIKIASHIGRQIISWETSNVGCDTEQWSKYSNFSQRMHSNSWPYCRW